MKPWLAIGLGNPLMGDDGIGWHAAGRLAADPRLPYDVEVVQGGTDILRCAGWIEGRRHVVFIDAVHDEGEPGSVSVLEGGLEERQDHAHHLSAAQGMKLLQLMMPVRMTLVGVSVSGAALSGDLSPVLAARLPGILDRVLEVFRWSFSM